MPNAWTPLDIPSNVEGTPVSHFPIKLLHSRGISTTCPSLPKCLHETKQKSPPLSQHVGRGAKRILGFLAMLLFLLPCFIQQYQISMFTGRYNTKNICTDLWTTSFWVNMTFDGWMTLVLVMLASHQGPSFVHESPIVCSLTFFPTIQVGRQRTCHNPCEPTHNYCVHGNANTCLGRNTGGPLGR